MDEVVKFLQHNVPFSLPAAGITRGLLLSVARGAASGAYTRAACFLAESRSEDDSLDDSAPRLVGAVLTVAVPSHPMVASAVVTRDLAKRYEGGGSSGGGSGKTDSTDSAAENLHEDASASPAPPCPPTPKNELPPPPPRPFHLRFDLLQLPAPVTSEVILVLAVAVARPWRREGLGTELVYAGVRELARSKQTGTAAAALIYAPYGHDASSAFVEALGFHAYARASRHYASAPGDAQDATHDALLFVCPLNEMTELVEYSLCESDMNAAAAAGAPLLPDVSDPAALKRYRVHRAPRWASTAAARCLLPLAILAVLFAAVYFLILSGPLAFLVAGLRPPPGVIAQRTRFPPESVPPAVAATAAGPFISPPGISILWTGGAGRDALGDDEAAEL